MQAKDTSDDAHDPTGSEMPAAWDARPAVPADHAEDVQPSARVRGRSREKPLLMVDIDGVISLFGSAGQAPWAGHTGAPEGLFHTVEGIPHFLSRDAAGHLLSLAADFDLVWASGWEEKAEEYLPRLLDLPTNLPFLRFERSPGRANAHWKLAAIEEHAHARACAWIDDAFNDACHAWAAARAEPTLLVQTAPERGLTSTEAQLLARWARQLAPPPTGAAGSHAPGATLRR